MANGFGVRRAGPEDLSELLRLRMAFFEEFEPDATARELAALEVATRDYLELALPANQFMGWVAEARDQIVGTGGLVWFHRPPLVGDDAGLEGYVMNMYTLPAWRDQGVASAILQAIVAFVKETSRARRIWLRATTEGQGVYRRAGFTTNGPLYMELRW